MASEITHILSRAIHLGLHIRKLPTYGDRAPPLVIQQDDLVTLLADSASRAADSAAREVPDIDVLANFIRVIDGTNKLGAGALAERIVEWLRSPAAPAAVPAATREYTDGTRTLRQDCISAVLTFKAMQPEEGESWESWYEAAFDMLWERLGSVFDEHAAAQPSAGAPAAEPVGTVIVTHRLPNAVWEGGPVTSVRWHGERPASGTKLYALPAREGEQAGDARTPGLLAAADHIDGLAANYIQEHARPEEETGAVVFDRRQAGADYYNTLVELAHELRSIATGKKEG